MKHRFGIVIGFVALVALAAQLRAQEQYPRGENVRGTVSSIDENKLVITDGSDTDITLTAQTHYRKVDDTTHEFKDVPRDQVKKGMYATVANARNGNEIIARYVFIATDRDTMNAGWALKHEEDAKKAAAAATQPATAPASTEPSASLSHQDPTVAAVKTGANGEKFLQMHQKFLARAKAGNVGVLFLGDSITANWTKAPDVWAKYYEPLHAANFGIGGDRTQHVLWRIDNGELDGISPKVVVLMIGTNNSNSDAAEPIAAAIEKIVGEIHDRLPQSKLLLLGVFPRNKTTDKPGQMDKIRQINETISKLDDGGKTVKYLDIGDKFTGPDGKVPADLFPDGLHPNEKGYQIWADAMQPTLEAMLK